jgi:hypothetical protein
MPFPHHSRTKYLTFINFKHFKGISLSSGYTDEAPNGHLKWRDGSSGESSELAFRRSEVVLRGCNGLNE